MSQEAEKGWNGVLFEDYATENRRAYVRSHNARKLARYVRPAIELARDVAVVALTLAGVYAFVWLYYIGTTPLTN